MPPQGLPLAGDPNASMPPLSTARAAVGGPTAMSSTVTCSRSAARRFHGVPDQVPAGLRSQRQANPSVPGVVTCPSGPLVVGRRPRPACGTRPQRSQGAGHGATAQNRTGRSRHVHHVAAPGDRDVGLHRPVRRVRPEPVVGDRDVVDEVPAVVAVDAEQRVVAAVEPVAGDRHRAGAARAEVRSDEQRGVAQLAAGRHVDHVVPHHHVAAAALHLATVGVRTRAGRHVVDPAVLQGDVVVELHAVVGHPVQVHPGRGPAVTGDPVAEPVDLAVHDRDAPRPDEHAVVVGGVAVDPRVADRHVARLDRRPSR